MMIVCLLVQVAAAYWSVRNFMQQAAHLPPRPGFVAGSYPLMIAMLIMMLGNVVQIALWGVMFVLLGEFTDAGEAVYHSAVNYASLGYGDIVMSASWRMLGALEALNGVLMLGMTGAALMAILQHMIKLQREASDQHD